MKTRVPLGEVVAILSYVMPNPALKQGCEKASRPLA
jgi:hypothetical protein